jgi:hypothetical protein
MQNEEKGRQNQIGQGCPGEKKHQLRWVAHPHRKHKSCPRYLSGFSFRYSGSKTVALITRIGS